MATTFEKGNLIYEGKAKKLYEVKGEPDQVLQVFKDSLTAFNGEKKGSFSEKGVLNHQMTSLIFRYLGSKGVAHHWVQDVSPGQMLTKKLTIIPLEVVVRNKVAGSLAKKFKKPEGTPLTSPLVELYFKSDELGDPFINDEHAVLFGMCTSEELKKLKSAALKINEELKTFFGEVGLDLIDFKLEFGKTRLGEIVLADEITPDSCRLWDQKTQEKMDKDRFRRDLGGIEEAYLEVSKRLMKAWEAKI